jgi:copper(I)-binding protein
MGEVVAAVEKSRGHIALLCLLSVAQLSAPVHSQTAESRVGNLIITEARARATPPGVSVGVIYFSIANAGAKSDRLLSVSTRAATKVELHESHTVRGVVEMRAVTSVECPPGTTVKSEPGGLHVMLIGLSQPLRLGTEIPVALQFRDAGILMLKVPVI